LFGRVGVFKHEGYYKTKNNKIKRKEDVHEEEVAISNTLKLRRVYL
jgi:hypothetical protein